MHGFGDASHVVPSSDEETNWRRYERGRGSMRIYVYVGEPRSWFKMTFLDKRIEREIKRYLILILLTFNSMYSYIYSVMQWMYLE